MYGFVHSEKLFAEAPKRVGLMSLINFESHGFASECVEQIYATMIL